MDVVEPHTTDFIRSKTSQVARADERMRSFDSTDSLRFRSQRYGSYRNILLSDSVRNCTETVRMLLISTIALEIVVIGDCFCTI